MSRHTRTLGVVLSPQQGASTGPGGGLGIPYHSHPCEPRQVPLSESQPPPHTMQVGRWAGLGVGQAEATSVRLGWHGLEPVFPYLGHDLQGPAVSHCDRLAWIGRELALLLGRLEQLGAKDTGEVVKGYLIDCLLLCHPVEDQSRGCHYNATTRREAEGLCRAGVFREGVTSTLAVLQADFSPGVSSTRRTAAGGAARAAAHGQSCPWATPTTTPSPGSPRQGRLGME
ncbi:LOW QUALITY PROTEIN: uncharacterized protein LOC131382803 [Hylobates moloch]|uniref:LOW QUALITY PROTEIN: uncharacterized protein LOC131382803 n=1 Tax=Hylobates moloch TaxID=81572 RepID=UPI002675F775|nr:LOW QUALITY PROTEIN: uncharacterized protein LOC131382803 [Hylobates moloch]